MDIKKEAAQNDSAVKPKVGKSRPPIDIGWLDLRVATVNDLQFHQWDDNYYIILADIGERILRLFINKLSRYLRPSKIRHEDNRFVALCNINYINKAGVTTSGRLLIADAGGKRELLRAPFESNAGDLVTVAGYPRQLYDPVAVLHKFDQPFRSPKRRLFAGVAADLRVNSDRVAVYKDIPLNVEGKGFIMTKELSDCPIR